MRILFVGPGEPAPGCAGLVEDGDDVEVLDDHAACVARLGELSRDGVPPELVVIGPAVSRPLSAARAIRAEHQQVGLAVVVNAGERSSMQEKVALSPAISDAAVLSAAAVDLGQQLHGIAQNAGQRRRVESALDEMNVELQRQEIDRRTAQAARSVSDQHLSALTRHAPDAIISVDTTGTVASWNRAATTIFGWEAEQTEGVDLPDLLSPSDHEELRGMIQQAAQGPTPPHRDVELLTEDGNRITAAVTAAPVRDSRQRVAGVVVIARDVTEQRRTDEQLRHLQKAQSLATLAGGVAHDFNNLLVNVQGWSELALEEPDDPELVREALQQIQRSSGQAADLARQMLAYSGRSTVTFQAVDINEIVTDMSSLLRSSITRKVDLDTTLEESLPQVHADPTQIRQIVMNLVTNAAEALADGPGRIEIRTATREIAHEHTTTPGRPELGEGLHVVMSVADTGPGMDPDTEERIFDPFFTTKFTGRGLGLAAALGIAQAHRGTIEVRSEPGAGAEFEVLLPAASDDSSSTGPQRANSRDGRPTVRPGADGPARGRRTRRTPADREDAEQIGLRGHRRQQRT